MQQACSLAPLKRHRLVAKAMTVRRPRRRIVAALLLWSVWCGQDAGTTALIPTGLMRAIGSIPKAAGWAEKYTEVPDFPLQKVSVMNPERSAVTVFTQEGFGKVLSRRRLQLLERDTTATTQLCSAYFSFAC